MWSVEKQCILCVYSVYTQPMSCILGGFCFFPQCIIHNRLMGGWIWESVCEYQIIFFNILSDVYSVCVCWMYNMEQFPAKETEARVWVLAATVYTCLGYSHHLLISFYLHFYKNLSYVIYIPIPEDYTMYKINFVQDNGWLIHTDSYCVVYPVPQFPPSPDLIPQQIQPQGHQTDASGEWKTMPHLLASRTICSNCNWSNYISHHLLCWAAIPSNCNLCSVHVTWYNVHILRWVWTKIFHPWVMLRGTVCMFCDVTICTCFMISEDTDLSGDTHTCHHCLQSKQMGTQGWPPTNNHKSTLISSGTHFDHFSIGSWALISEKIQGKWEKGKMWNLFLWWEGEGGPYSHQKTKLTKKGSKKQNRILFDDQGIPMLGVFADLGKLQ